jgi:hypothetical protein
MNFAATVPHQRRAMARRRRLLVSFMKIGEQLKIQSVAMEHARNCAANQDWPGVQIGLAVLCCAAQDIRKIAAKANEKLSPEIDDATETYGEVT